MEETKATELIEELEAVEVKEKTANKNKKDGIITAPAGWLPVPPKVQP